MIKIDSKTLRRNKVLVVKGIKRTTIVRLPTKAPNIILFNEVPLFKIILVTRSNMKSNIKFKNIIKSTYIFIVSPLQVYKTYVIIFVVLCWKGINYFILLNKLFEELKKDLLTKSF